VRYLVLAYGDRKKNEALSSAEFEAILAKCKPCDEELRSSGHLVSAESLEWDSVTIRPQDGKTVTTDGPYAETKEQIGGVIIIEARDMDEAVRIAKMHPAAQPWAEHLGWWIELRPFAAGCHK
jgi:hypothetical protein